MKLKQITHKTSQNHFQPSKPKTGQVKWFQIFLFRFFSKLKQKSDKNHQNHFWTIRTENRSCKMVSNIWDCKFFETETKSYKNHQNRFEPSKPKTIWEIRFTGALSSLNHHFEQPALWFFEEILGKRKFTLQHFK